MERRRWLPLILTLAILTSPMSLPTKTALPSPVLQAPPSPSLVETLNKSIPFLVALTISILSLVLLNERLMIVIKKLGGFVTKQELEDSLKGGIDLNNEDACRSVIKALLSVKSDEKERFIKLGEELVEDYFAFSTHHEKLQEIILGRSLIKEMLDKPPKDRLPIAQDISNQTQKFIHESKKSKTE